MKNERLKQLKAKEQECEELKEKVKELRQGWVNCDKERNIQEANSEFNKRVADRYEQKLKKIKEFATALCYTVMSDGVVILQRDILKIIDKVENV